MTIYLFRSCFCFPVLLLIWGFLDGSSMDALPTQAKIYSDWYMVQPLSGKYLLANRVALTGMLTLILATAGLYFFYSPARYLYVVSIFLMMIGEISDAPVLLSSAASIRDSLSGIFIGFNIALVFTGPAKLLFGGGHKASPA